MTTLRPAFSATTQRFTPHLAHRFTPLQAATLTLVPTADAYVQAGNNANKNYGSATTLRVQTNSTAAKNYDSYLKFDTSPVSGNISNAKLRVYAKLSASGTVSSSAYAIATTTWGENTLTWNNKPARGAALGNISVTSTGYAWKEIDVTPYVQSEYAANRKVLSFAYNSSTSSLLTTLQSREGTNKPQLVITTSVAPTMSLTAPANGASYTALASVTLTANAADSDGTIANVGFYNGATLINTDTSAPYSYIWTGVASGSYILTAKATDNAGAITTSSPINISVTANQAPTVNLQAPTSSDSFTAPATFSIIASAADSDGSIQKVEFYNGAALLGSATQSPYLYDWLNVAAGSYTLTAKAFDNANASTISAPVNITVNAPQVAAGIYYIFADHLNTARVITDQANKTVWRWESDPFGTSAPFEDPDGDGVKFGYNLRFPGQYFDAESGLHQNYFRDYDPSTGRYVQSDPIGLAGGLNTFGYANQNPLSFTDPLGLAPKNDPQRRPKTEHEVDLGDLPEATGGILCALGIGACLPPNLFRCTKMRCTPPQCGGTPYFLDYRLPGHQLVDPNASCECVDKGFNPNFRGNIPGL